MRAFLVLAALATSSALKVADPATKVATKVPAAKLPSSAASALALRGGGVVSGSVWLKSFSAFMGMYAVGFVLAPATVIEQNFDTPYDKYHLFISRLSGIAFLTLIYTFSTMETAAAVPIALTMACLTAVFGPIYAELKLETKPAHKMAFLMAPLIVSGFLAL
ncbi:hypothetical protein EMIHUDRAFT_202059 [Emiliania huxleyi CCMP1516]|uniref:EamA domain-containing protein n=2 Tax=Emiliania huxleyi TaxID=2903 RepID=A0A0D3KEZ0_EMIH1|nr:hypothetical protein EMIHUDRAFT_202059 [Emiliania huxleyi CCMP1516]EOD34325.1 hypothetical protein EMIHUDRAFT_202059 [Emiliania huxleyi CCMP1516]|eukprot:XP_005786754.1 hypothetical protein EMIHUDRAFT_202059 [Emiliania huxleyi CCMP1516]